jgi:hypothetical protein
MKDVIIVSAKEFSPSFRNLLSSAISFSFSNKRQFIIVTLGFMLPFLLFIPTLFVGLTIQSSFLQEYQTLHPMVLDSKESIQYKFQGSYITNTSTIPSDLLSRISIDIEEILSLSSLTKFVTNFSQHCYLEIESEIPGTFTNQINTLFLKQTDLNSLAAYCLEQN